MHNGVGFCLSLFFLLTVHCFELTGPHKDAFDIIFASRVPEEVVSVSAGLQWTEGPTWVPENGRNPAVLLFSDTIKDKIYSFEPKRNILSVFLNSSGECSEGCEEKAEPGSNGLLFSSPLSSVSFLYACRHGAREVARLEFSSMSWTTLATEFGGKRFNSPNDLSLHRHWLYFTDPVYGFLEKSRFYDAPYLDDRVRERGAGVKGVYRVHLVSRQVELIDASMHRPNGIQVADDGTVYVCECCQGIGCPQGEAILNVFRLKDHSTSKFHKTAAIKFEHPKGTASKGCCDGFKIHKETRWIVGSCPGPGLCIIDVKQEKFLARLETPFKLSNVAFTPDYLYITGEKSVWRLPLVKKSRDEL